MFQQQGNRTMNIVLVGDSVFDNGPYVNDGEEVSQLLSDFSRIWGLANLEERKRLLRASLEAAYIEKSAITAVKPRPEFYNLIYRSGGPDGIRTRDLCLDRAAC